MCVQSTAESIFSITCSKCAQIQLLFCLFVWLVGAFFSHLSLVMLMWSLIGCTHVLLTRICYSSIVTPLLAQFYLYVYFFSLSVQFSMNVIGKQFSAIYLTQSCTHKHKDKISVDFFLAGILL